MSRRRIFYLVDTKTGKKIDSSDKLSECQIKKREKNREGGENRYACEGHWEPIGVETDDG